MPEQQIGVCILEVVPGVFLLGLPEHVAVCETTLSAVAAR